MSQPARTEFSAREFNRDPSAIGRAARAFGEVVVTNRGRPWLVVVDANVYSRASASHSPQSLLSSLVMAEPVDEAVLGEPPRAALGLKLEDLT